MIGSAFLSTWFPTDASTHATGVDSAFFSIGAVAIIVLVVLFGLAVVVTLTHLRKSSDPERVPAGGLNLPLLGIWVVGSLAIAGFVFTIGLPGFLDQSVAPYGAYNITVNARQGAWGFTYPNGHESDTLRVKVDTPVRLTLNSADVAQTISVPELRLQQAILPGTPTEAWFEATAPGVFPIHSGAYSAATHDSLKTAVLSLTPDEFKAWLASVEDIFVGRTLAEVGELLYTSQGCAVCHSLDGSTVIGPSFKDVYGFEFLTTDGTTVLADDAYIKESILDPNASIIDGYLPVMTPYAGILGDREIEAITAFMKTLSERGDTALEN
ncbi:MAG: cytochrome c oxidase subunit 2 [Candidatus Krumholzibacteriia bacterium]